MIQLYYLIVNAGCGCFKLRIQLIVYYLERGKKMRKEKIDITLVVPCYNEEENILLFVETVKTVFVKTDLTIEYIFINDGSKDNTMQVLQNMVQLNTEDKITVLSFSRNFGKEAAILAGLKETHGEFTCLIDADLQQNPCYVLWMYEHLQEHEEFDCIAAYQENRREGKILVIFKNLFYKMINRISQVEFVNGASDFRMFRRYVVDAVLSLPEYNRFSKGLFSWVGFQTCYFPYKVENRANGTSSWSFWKLLKYAIEGIVSFTTVPLRASTLLGFFISFIAFIYLITVIVQKLFYGIAISGYPTIIVLILLLGGIQLLVVGIFGEYLAKMYQEVKGRPSYIIKDKIESKKDIDNSMRV